MTAPFTETRLVNVGPVATAGNDLNTVAFIAPADGVISAVKYTTITAITGAATNNRTVSLVNAGHTDGSGTTSVASLSFASGTDTVAAFPKSITLSATAADLAVSAGDVLVWKSTHVGTGIADPGGLVSIQFSRSYA